METDQNNLAGGGRPAAEEISAMASTRHSETITVEPLAAGEEDQWSEFLAASGNGTLFHDLRFLAYHPPGKFDFKHLVVRQGGVMIALLPGGIVESGGKRLFVSPLGVSVGGPVVTPELNSRQTLDLIKALQDYAVDQGWDGVRMTLAPPIYDRRPADTLSFGLFCSGFHLENRWLCHFIPLQGESGAGYEKLFRERQARRVRALRRKGMTVVEEGIDGLAAFLLAFRDTYDRHGVKPTHTPDEIADLLCRLPDRVRLYIAFLGHLPVSGTLVFLLNSRIAYTFYISMRSEYAHENGNVVIVAALLDRLAKEGYQWLDLGPSAQFGRFNDGVAFFKEGLGAIGYCRDQWYWLSTRERSSPLDRRARAFIRTGRTVGSQNDDQHL
jgi:hypothetical protein